MGITMMPLVSGRNSRKLSNKSNINQMLALARKAVAESRAREENLQEQLDKALKEKEDLEKDFENEKNSIVKAHANEKSDLESAIREEKAALSVHLKQRKLRLRVHSKPIKKF